MFIISLIFSVITGDYNNNLDNYNKKLNNTMNDYIDEKIDSYEYLDSYESIIYDGEKSSVYSNGIYLVLCVGYFVLFQYLNKGQTIGKRIMHIRIIKEDGSNIRFIDMIIRTSFINEILPGIISLILILTCSKRIFFIGYTGISFIENIVILISAIMLLCRKDGKALRDIITKSMVIDERV